MAYFFHLLHSLINMGKEMSTLHTLIHNIHTLIPPLSPAYNSYKYKTSYSSTIHNQMNTYLSEIFVHRKVFYSFPLFFFQNFLFWIQTFGLYMQRKIRSRKFLYSNNTRIRSTTSP